MKDYRTGTFQMIESCHSRNSGGRKDVAGAFKVLKAGVNSEFSIQ